jgi:hypothetical protein
VRRVTRQSSAEERACWLAALAEALDEAQKLSWRLGTENGNPAAMELYSRVETIRLEVQALRLGRVEIVRNGHDPYWTKFSPVIGNGGGRRA